MVRKGGEFAHKCSESITARFVIMTFTKGQSNIATHFQIDTKAAISYLWAIGGLHNINQQVHLELPSQKINCTVFRECT